MRSRLFYHTSLDWSMSIRMDGRLVFIITMFFFFFFFFVFFFFFLLLFFQINPVFNTKSVDTDQTYAEPDLGRHYLPMPLFLWNARNK